MIKKINPDITNILPDTNPASKEQDCTSGLEITGSDPRDEKSEPVLVFR